MIGSDVKSWRERNGYTQSELQSELGIKSRTSMSSLENSDRPIPRNIELALAALEIAPLLRKYYGKARGKDPKKFNYPAVTEEQVRDLFVQVSNGIYKK